MKRFLIALAACTLIGTCFVQSAPTPAIHGVFQASRAITQDAEPKLVVEGPTKAKAGDLVVLSVEKSSAKTFKWLVRPSTDNYLVIDEGKRIVFSSGVSGKFDFIVACSLGDQVQMAEHTVTVVGELSPADTLSSKVAHWCDEVQSDTKRDDCIKLAQSFSSIALVMEGGNLTTPSQIIDATVKSNQDALGTNIEKWLPFRTGLSNELTKLAADGKLTDTKSHIEVWKSVASALREYASTL